MIRLPDGRKLEPAPTYLSAQEMLAKGRNSFGVLAIHYAFYPGNYKPLETSESGASKAEYERQVKALGRDAVFRPKNAPRWDNSYDDPSTMKHDCFTAQRLFTIPWGKGLGKVGDQDAYVKPEFRGWRWLPFVRSKGGIGSDIEVVEYWEERQSKVFRWNGEFIGAQSVSESFGRSRDCSPKYLGTSPGGYSFGAGEKAAIAFQGEDLGNPFCVVYLKSQSVSRDPLSTGPDTKFAGEVQSSSLFDCRGFLFPLATDSGVEIYFYEAR